MTGGAENARWAIVGGVTHGRDVVFVADLGRTKANLCFVLVKPVETLSEEEGRYWTRSDNDLRKDIGVEEIRFVMVDDFDWRSKSVGELLKEAEVRT